MQLITQNSKLKKTSKHFDKKVFNFGIPAYENKDKEKICIFADTCIKFCYARNGAYTWSNVKPAFEKRYQISKTDKFVSLMNEEIKRKKVDFLRVHDSGDYYSKEYLQKWFSIAKDNPKVKFYSYTNNVNQIKKAYEKNEVPKNYDFIFSDSGKQKKLINKKTDRHTKIFKSLEDLKKEGYKDSSKYDLYATKWFNDSNKVGLIFH